MQVTKDKVVNIEYTLKGDNGEVIDSSVGGDPLSYLHGHHGIIPGLEDALEGKAVGDKLDVTVAPAEGYGEHDVAMIQVVEKKLFEGMDVSPGMQFQAQTNQGVQVVTVTQVEGESVTIDGNHPLAGQTLHFDVEVKEIRDASEEELAHGHVHGPGGHQH